MSANASNTPSILTKVIVLITSLFMAIATKNGFITDMLGLIIGKFLPA